MKSRGYNCNDMTEKHKHVEIAQIYYNGSITKRGWETPNSKNERA